MGRIVLSNAKCRLLFFALVLVVILSIQLQGLHTLSISGKGLRFSLHAHGTPEISPPILPHSAFLSNGLLSVDQDDLRTTHPILALVHNAQLEWNDKLSRASRTLEDAVEEYRRRYGRPPPLGFDLWWKFAVEENNVQLPDEYDQINYDLAPYWGISPADMKTLHERRTQELWTIVIGKDNPSDPVAILNFTFPEDMIPSEVERFLDGAEAFQVSVLQPVEMLLPPFRILYWPHDNGNLFREWNAREAAVEAASKGEHFDILNWEEEENRPWESACPPDSPARLYSTNFSDIVASPFSSLDDSTSSQALDKTFIHTPSLTYTPCTHPSLLRLHGAFLASHPFPGPGRIRHSPSNPIPQLLVPQLSLSRVAVNDDLISAHAYGWSEEHPGDLVSWEEKADERLLWRGWPTGMGFGEETRWRESQRPRLVDLGSANLVSPSRPSLGYDACVLSPSTPKSPTKTTPESGDVPCVDSSIASLGQAYLDVGFTSYEPMLCDDDDKTCDQLVREYQWSEWVDQENEGKWKFIFDVDGNGWSGRFRRLLSSGSLIFKATIYPEWWTDRIQPWLHYVPIQVDYSDLFDALAYFRGSIPGVEESESEKNEADARARKIAEAGREWSDTFWRREDLTAYQFRLILEYIRLMDPERDTNPDVISYHLPSNGGGV